MKRTCFFLLLGFLAIGCGPAAPDTEESRAASPAIDPEVEAGPPSARIVVLGDSITAGFGLDTASAYPSLVERALVARGWGVEVINAGVSGDTTAGGRSRLDWLLRQRPDLLVVALGANDGLRGGSLAAMESNLRDMVRRGLGAGARVLVLGMKIPPNYGQEYTREFEAIFSRLAGEFDVTVMPFLLEGVGGRPELNQADGIHPNAEGQRRLATAVLPYFESELRALGLAPVAERSGQGEAGP